MKTDTRGSTNHLTSAQRPNRTRRRAPERSDTKDMIDTSIRVLVADSNELFSLGLSCLLDREPDIQVVGVASSVTETLLKLAQHRPDVLLVESRMRDSNGLPAVLQAMSRYADTRVTVITASDTDADLQAALQLGVQGYILKDSSLDEVVQAVRAIAKGEMYYSKSVYARVRNLTSAKLSNGRSSCTDRGIFSLSERERSVLRLVAAGATNQEIGDALGIATNTVKVHLRAILDKLNVRNRQQAAAYAVQEGLVGRLFPAREEQHQEYAGAGLYGYGMQGYSIY
jgi:DNA-binding NarL/FixJ family response regulator